MRLLFLIPFTTAVITSYFFQQTTQEMAYLMGTIAMVSLILSLLMAPWQVQLIIVIVAVIIARQGWRQLQETEKDEEVVKSDEISTISQEKYISREQIADPNKYRGVNYVFPIIANISRVKIEGKYRGNPLPYRQLSQNFVLAQKSKLKYRGVDIFVEKALPYQNNFDINKD